ncbi:MAG: histidine kinase [Gemmatimonadetes bacterium]|nr:histidine kinase [Gemmatimonadota bacterium]
MATHERRITALAIGAGLPSTIVAVTFLHNTHLAAGTRWTAITVLVLWWLWCILFLRESVVRPLQTLANMLAAIREQDYSHRAIRHNAGDALGLAMLEINGLMADLRERRLGALEATALLRRVMTEIDVTVLAFDEEGALRLANAAGERLFERSSEQLLGRRAEELGVGETLSGDTPRVVELTFGGRRGRWELRRGAFRQGGQPHQFVVLTDVSRSLREEERLAWQRIIRVLGHEINNSLTPIRSLAERLRELLDREPPDGELRDDLQRGLGVIANRSAGLTRFLGSYAQLAKLPPPKRAPLSVRAWIERVVRLESRLDVVIQPDADVTIDADGDQLDQLLINLVKNAVDAALSTQGGVRVRWQRDDAGLTVDVEDDGPGLPASANLFVPFFTTKPGGTGIGLVLSREIAELHGGVLTVENRSDARGCIARFHLARP